jgi:hypothetical protein
MFWTFVMFKIGYPIPIAATSSNSIQIWNANVYPTIQIVNSQNLIILWPNISLYGDLS